MNEYFNIYDLSGKIYNLKSLRKKNNSYTYKKGNINKTDFLIIK